MTRTVLAILAVASIALAACTSSSDNTGGGAAAADAAAASAATGGAAEETTSPADAGGGSGGGGEAAANACEFLEPGDVESAYGYPVTEEPPALEGDTGCAYDDADGETVVSLGYLPDYGADNFPTYRDMQDDAEDVEGIGDGAFWSGGQLHIIKGEAYLTINPQGGRLQAESEEETIRSATEDLAGTAVDNMP